MYDDCLRRSLVTLLLLPLLLTACSKPTDPAWPPIAMPETPPAVQPAEPARPGPREQAMVLLAQGKPAEAASLLRELAAAEPTADRYSDLSHAYLMAKEYKLALEAGHAALRLDDKHARADYNVGLAYLEMGEIFDAPRNLLAAAKAEPGWFEPHLALARAYAAQRRGALAAYHLKEAERLASGNPQVQAHAPAVAALWERGPQQVPKGACHASKLELAYTICLAPAGEDYFDLYLLPASLNLPPERISLGRIERPDTTIQQVTLPGGVQGYWVLSDSYVYQIYQWRLFAVKEGRLQPVVALGGIEPIADYFRSSLGPPSIEGDTLKSTTVDPSRTGRVHSTWQLAPDLTSATLTSWTHTDGLF